MNLVKHIRKSFENDAPIFYITFAMLFLNVMFFLIGKLGVGNNILGFMVEAGRFDDFYNSFTLAPTLPNPNSAYQLSALAIIFSRIFAHHQIAGLIIVLLVGIFLPIYLIARVIDKYFDKNSLIYIIFIMTSYPFLFAFFRGNAALVAATWSILGVLSFLSGGTFIARSSIIIGSLFHPVPAFFSLLLLKDGIISFLKTALLICFLQLALYTALGKPLFETIANTTLSLEKYKAAYVIGGGGDLYNNSLFLLIKIVFEDNLLALNFALKFIPIFLLMVVVFKTYAGYRTHGQNYALHMFGLYLLPISLVVSSPVSADYRLTYLLIPVILMLLTRSFGLPFFLLFAALVPKHFIFFSSHWLSMHPTSSLVYPDLINSYIGITLNSFLNPPLLLICILLPNSYIEKFILRLLSKHMYFTRLPKSVTSSDAV